MGFWRPDPEEFLRVARSTVNAQWRCDFDGFAFHLRCVDLLPDQVDGDRKFAQKSCERVYDAIKRQVLGLNSSIVPFSVETTSMDMRRYSLGRKS